MRSSIKKAATKKLKEAAGAENLAHADLHKFPETAELPTSDKIAKLAKEMALFKLERKSRT